MNYLGDISMKQKSLSELNALATEWNVLHPIGTRVMRYRLINPLREGSPTRTLSEAWVMGGHSVMINVDGVVGGVCLESVQPI
jgi:hypothetical protein